MEWIYYAVAAVIGLVVGSVIGFIYCKKHEEKKTDEAKKTAKEIVEDAIRDAETKRKEAVIGVKEEVLAIRNEAEAELRERRKEVARQERRIAQKEESLDSKTDALEKKEQILQNTQREAEELKEKIQEKLNEQITALEKISGTTASEAKDELLHRMESEISHETAIRLSEYEARFREESGEMAKEILSMAIQRCAADHVGEATISVVNLPNEEMKGRIIGREGRNIRSIETLTGVELIVDDTPEVITISGFDPVRREVARLAMEKLMADGRIHPAKIEEMVEKAKKDVDNAIKQAGDKAIFETGVHGLHPELVRLLGRLKYRTSYGQNVLRHSIEVSLIAGIIADEIGADGTMARRAGLLHDIGKALTQEAEGSHIQLGVEVAKKYHENKDIIHAIEAHHNDVEPKTVLAFIIQAADAISAARPGARRENVENYIKRLQKLEEIAGSFEGVDKSFAIQAGREVRIMVKPELVSDDKMIIIAHDIAKKIEEEMDYPGQIKVNMIRESRAVDFAK
ncbi:MAG: ribonuclease Y [Eubacteriales bacterium]|nr:ribonuclease Y [Eubacteriales bacterium]